MILSFEEAAFGCEKEITVERIESCDDCGGTGAAKGTTAETCPNCRGTGVVTQTQRTPLGMFQTQGACPNCRGTRQDHQEAVSEVRRSGPCPQDPQVKGQHSGRYRRWSVPSSSEVRAMPA